MRGDLPTGTVTFLFTDIEGSTRLLHRLGPDAYARALAEHRRVLRQGFAANGGVEVDTQGDAFFVAFTTPTGAAAAAALGQESLASGPIHVGMGLHTGRPTRPAEGYVGADVHLGARVAALAHGGQVLLTDAVRALLPGEGDRRLTDLGQHRLKDIDDAVRLFQLGDAPFPPLRTPGALDLPTPVTRFIGREQELFDAVSTWLNRDPRILTIVGPGGTGKTRFTLELARLLAEEADGGTVFVPLAPHRDGALVIPAIAERLGSASADISGIASRVGDRRTHVVLDNVEQLLPDAAVPLAALMAAAPQLRLLVTSREPLKVSGEVELDLPPLQEDDAVELFLERARAVRPEIAESTGVHELVRRLDRLPLALELAAARVKLLAPDQLLDRFSQQLPLLRGTRDADERHATLYTTIAWSHDLLDQREQGLFARLAVFRNGFTLGAAEQVCDATVDGLASLLDKSLLRRHTDPDVSERLWMLETIREFARERLAGVPEVEELLSRRHATFVLGLARSAHLSSEDQGRFEPEHERVLAERDEVRAALDWAVANERLLAAEIVAALEGYWATSAPQEGLDRVEALLRDSMLPPDLRARLLRMCAGLNSLRGETELGETYLQQSLELFRELGDVDNVVALLARIAARAGWAKDPEEARRLVAETRTLNKTVGNPTVEAQMLSTLGQVARREGDAPAALELLRASVAAARASGFRMWALWSLAWQLDVELEFGLLEQAEQTGREGLELATQLDDRLRARSLLVGLARVALDQGQLERAGTLWGAVAEAERETPLLALIPEYAESAAPLASCTADSFLAGSDNGRLLSLEQAAARALEDAQTEP
jgi:predicted ATPase/class 3 adenylate cyclase